MNKYAKDIRFKPHVDLRVAGLGFESTASIAKETLSDYASVLHNQSHTESSRYTKHTALPE